MSKFMSKNNKKSPKVSLSYDEERLLSSQLKHALYKLGQIKHDKLKQREIKSTKKLRKKFKDYFETKSYNSALFSTIQFAARKSRIYDLETIQSIVDYAVANGKA